VDSALLARLSAAFPRVSADDVARLALVLTNSSPVEPLSPDHLGPIQVGADVLAIPARVYFDAPSVEAADSTALLTACLFTRHHDGFVRERNVVPLLSSTAAWTAPYVFALLGEYVVDIIARIERDATSAVRDAMVEVALGNPTFAAQTRSRVVSYWDCYYRQVFNRFSDYPGFRLLDSLGLWPEHEARSIRPRRTSL
jgi:hypothetical protein